MKKIVYIWCCDKNHNSGEGILANKFIQDLKKYNPEYKFNIKLPSKEEFDLLRKFLGKIIDRLFIPIKGIFYLWLIYFQKKNIKLCYVNYLPLWNPLLFVLMPPNTILGPITGGSKFLKKPFLNYIIRKYFFSLLYKVSIKILNLRQKKIFFSTSLLKKEFKKNKKHFYDYVLKDFKIINKQKKRKYDLIFYLREHKNKNTTLQINLAKKLCNQFKIITIGKKVNHPNIKNFGHISRAKLYAILQKTKYSFISPENNLSFFAIDSVSNGTYIFSDDQRNIFKNKVKINYEKHAQLLQIINNVLSGKYQIAKNFNLKDKNNYFNYFKI